MSERKYTPGPWIVNPLHTRSPYGVCTAKSSADLAKVYVTDPDTRKRTPEYEGNLRLIAAAPELLEALERVVQITEIEDAHLANFGEFEAARAAIAKAKGE